MHKKYLNSPIKEVVCEFRLPHESQWDISVPDKVYETLKNDFPNKESRYIQEVQFSRDPQNPKLMQQQIRTNELLVFLSEDRTKLIQIGPHLLAINKLKPYLGWEDFSKDISMVLEELNSKIKMNSFQRIGLRYINQVALSKDDNSNDYFTAKIILNNHSNYKIENTAASFSLGINKTDNCQVQFKHSLSDNEQICLLDLDYFLQKPGVVKFDDALNWVSNAHEKIYEIFDSCLTEKSKKLFGGKNETSL